MRQREGAGREEVNPCAFMLFTMVRLLNTAQGSLLDDEALVNALQSSKKTAEEVSEKLQTSEQTEIKIDAAREVCLHPFIIISPFLLSSDTRSTLLTACFNLSNVIPSPSPSLLPPFHHNV